MLACSRLDVTHTADGLRAFLQDIRRFAQYVPTEAELESAKAVLAAEWDASEDSLADAVSQYEQAIGEGDEALTAERVTELRAVSLPEVQALARTIGDSSHLQIVTAGEQREVEQAVRELKLGALRTPLLERVETEEDE